MSSEAGQLFCTGESDTGVRASYEEVVLAKTNLWDRRNFVEHLSKQECRKTIVVFSHVFGLEILPAPQKLNTFSGVLRNICVIFKVTYVYVLL